MSDVSPEALAARLKEALSLHGAGQLEAASAIYRDIIAQDPRHFDALHLLGVVHMQRSDAASAVAFIGQAVAINPDHAPALSNLAVALRTRGDLSAALSHFERAAALQPHNAETAFNRALVLMDLKRFAAALAGFDRAIAADPRHASAHIGRGNALERLGRLAEAVDAYAQARAVQPRSVAALHNLGCAVHSLGRIEEARALFHEALRIEPNSAETHLVLAESHLLTGEFTLGWPEYEWRWRVDGMMGSQRRDFGQPQWRGEDIAGRTILLWAEQGFGDMLQFCRFANVVAARGARVVLEVPAEMAALMRGLRGVATVVGRGDPLPAFDVHTPLMSLPLALGADAAPERTAGPYLAADPARREAWRARLSQEPGRRIGLAWAGRASHRNDHARSLDPTRLAPLFALADIRFIAVQPGVASTIRDAGLPILAAEPTDFADSAALIASLDLVITVDTAVAHLAGALGTEMWLLLPMIPDWRWQLGRDDSAWYPSARLFRQRSPNDWPGVIARVADALSETSVTRDDA